MLYFIIDSSKTANKRISTNWKNEEVATLLGVWESHTEKQGIIDPSIKMQRLLFLANCPHFPFVNRANNAIFN